MTVCAGCGMECKTWDYELSVRGEEDRIFCSVHCLLQWALDAYAKINGLDTRVLV